MVVAATVVAGGYRDMVPEASLTVGGPATDVPDEMRRRRGSLWAYASSVVWTARDAFRRPWNCQVESRRTRSGPLTSADGSGC